MAQSLPAWNGEPPAATTGFTLLGLFSLPFCAVGLWLAAEALGALAQGAPAGETLPRLVFALVFGGSGFGMLFASRYLLRRARREHALRSRHPEEPWRWRPEWETGRVPARDREDALGLGVAAAFWNLMCLPFLIEGGAAALLVTPFLLIGAGLVFWALRSALRQRKFGRCVFELETLPGVLGGPLRGAIHVPVSVRPDQGFRLALRCIERVTTGAGKSRSTQEHTRWEEEQLVPPTAAMAAPQGTALPVRFEIPHGLPPSSAASSDDAIVWRLTARAAVPGLDLEKSFDVPVFRTSESRVPDGGADAAEVLVALGATPTPVAEGSRITATRLPDGGVEVFFPAARSPGGAMSITVLAIFWNAFLVFSAREAPLPIQLFLSIFFVVGFCLVLGALDGWLGTIRIRARRGELTATRRVLWIGRTRVYRPTEIGDLRVEAVGHVGKKIFYALKAQRADRKWRSILADGMTDRQQAERILALVTAAFEGPGR